MTINSSYGSEVSDTEAQREGNFKVKLASVGNPDFRQHPGRSLPGVPRKTVTVKTLQAASEACRKYISEHDLGGGNWAGGDVYEGNTLIARISYNGRIWTVPND